LCSFSLKSFRCIFLDSEKIHIYRRTDRSAHLESAHGINEEDEGKGNYSGKGGGKPQNSSLGDAIYSIVLAH